MTFLWLLTCAACLLALVAFLRARRLAKRLERLTESYWELRYDHGQLRSRVARLDPEPPPAGTPETPRPQGTIAFVPLSSIKR